MPFARTDVTGLRWKRVAIAGKRERRFSENLSRLETTSGRAGLQTVYLSNVIYGRVAKVYRVAIRLIDPLNGRIRQRRVNCDRTFHADRFSRQLTQPPYIRDKMIRAQADLLNTFTLFPFRAHRLFADADPSDPNFILHCFILPVKNKCRYVRARDRSGLLEDMEKFVGDKYSRCSFYLSAHVCIYVRTYICFLSASSVLYIVRSESMSG